jgi:hypothetical protein
MLNIAYAPGDAQLAERLQQDLTQAGLDVHNPLLLVLVSSDSVRDVSVRQAVASAADQGHVVALLLVQNVALPDAWRGYRRTKLPEDYNVNTLRVFINRADVSPGKRRTNNRLLLGALLLVLLIVGVSAWAIATDVVAFPVEEYMTENAAREQMIQELVFPTLDAWQPRTTEDAINFPLTVEAANTRNAPLLMMTATALPRDRQATLDAQATAADLTITARAQATETPAPMAGTSVN